jgi:hypothetical protein
VSRVQNLFTGLLVTVSGLAALAVWLLIKGATAAEPLAICLGAVVAVLALLGTVILARLVIVAERQRGRR